jgi:hypothetical protein
VFKKEEQKKHKQQVYWMDNESIFYLVAFHFFCLSFLSLSFHFFSSVGVGGSGTEADP